MRRRLLVLPLLVLAVGAELAYLQRDGRQPASELGQAQRALTLLDFWSQSAVPSVLAERSRQPPLALGHLAEAAAMAEHDPAFRQPDAPEVRAVRAAGAAWTAFAEALLSHAGTTPRRLAGLEATAIRLHQRAYAVVDASLLLHIRGARSSPGGAGR